MNDNQMKGGKRFTYDYRLPGRSVGPVFAKFREAVTAIQSRRVARFEGRAITQELYVNASIDMLSSLSIEQQERVLAEFIPRFEAMLTATSET